MTDQLESICKTCGDKKGWHHAKTKYQDKILVCYGIGCMCEGFT